MAKILLTDLRRGLWELGLEGQIRVEEKSG